MWSFVRVLVGDEEQSIRRSVSVMACCPVVGVVHEHEDRTSELPTEGETVARLGERDRRHYPDRAARDRADQVRRDDGPRSHGPPISAGADAVNREGDVPRAERLIQLPLVPSRGSGHVMARRRRRMPIFLAVFCMTAVAATSLCPVECFAKESGRAATSDCHGSKSPISGTGRGDAGCCVASVAPRASTSGLETVGPELQYSVSRMRADAAPAVLIASVDPVSFRVHGPPTHLLRSPILLI